ncbi:MAG: hypothetical protein WBB95_29780 [Pseudomonas sp.]|uniref:hypothetical protein n=1 Tax=Pseudomonas sp. TaxID=306 RepID=UPI003C728C78
MNFINAIWPIPGAIAAALVAGLISFVVTVLAKDQKTSEFRQAWIDGLRADVADFAGLAGAMAAVTNAKLRRGEDAESYLLARHDDFAKMESLINRIRLRLNPDEHSEILSFLGVFRTGIPSSREEIDEAVEGVVNCAQKILKSEWKRVKKGEPAYSILKKLSLFFTLAAVAAVFVLPIQDNKPAPDKSKPIVAPALEATPKSLPLAPSSSG